MLFQKVERVNQVSRLFLVIPFWKALVGRLIMSVASKQPKRNGSFKFAGMLIMKLKKKPATAARKGVNPSTKEPCVFKTKPASKTMRVVTVKNMKVSNN